MYIKKLWSKITKSAPKRLLVISAFLLFLTISPVQAGWNGNWYQPGETLDPECVPGDVDCGIDISAFKNNSPVEFNIDGNPWFVAKEDGKGNKYIVPASSKISLGSLAEPFKEIFVSADSVLVDGTRLSNIGGLLKWGGHAFTMTPTVSNSAEIRLGELSGNGSNYVALQAPATIASDVTLTLPATAGTNGQALATNGSGVLSWTSVLSPSLSQNQIFVGNASGIATGVAMGGDATISSAGSLTISTNAVALGTDTTGNYAAGNTAGTGIAISGTAGEGWSPTIGVASTVPMAVSNDTNITGSLASNTLTLDWTGQLGIARGGTNISSYTTGDLLYASAANTLAKRTIGSNGQVLTVSGGVPTWSAPSACTTCLVNNGNSFGALATIGTNDNQALTFETNSVERMRIDASGNVGIGTANPSVKLDVAGTLKATGFRLGESASAGQVLMANANGEGSWTSPMAGNPEISRVMSQVQYLYSPMKVINVCSVPNYSSDPLVLPDGYNGVNMYNSCWVNLIYPPVVAVSGTMFYVRTTASINTAVKKDRTDLATDLVVSNGNVAIFRSDGTKWVYYGTQSIDQLNWVASSTFVQGGNSFGASAVLGTNDNNALAFKTNNAERLRIDAGGSVIVRGYNGGTVGSAVAGYNKNLVIGGVYHNLSYNSGNAVLLHIADYSNDGGDNVYPIYVENENNHVDFYINSGSVGSVGTAYFGGNVGIGTATPATKLDVAGAIRTNNQLISTVATGTAPLTITSTTVVANLNADLLDGRHASEFQLALTNPVTGTGTNGYLPKFTGTSTIGNSLIYDNGTNVGIGTASPATKLDVAGDLRLQAQSDLRLADADSSNYVAFQAPATVTSNVTWTLPAADGSNGQVMASNGSGILSWITPLTTAVTSLNGLTATTQTFTNDTNTTMTSSGSTHTLGWTGQLAVARGGTGTNSGSITGTGALTFAAGGTNQNITLAPSGTGAAIFKGNVSVGTSAAPSSRFVVGGGNLIPSFTTGASIGLSSGTALDENTNIRVRVTPSNTPAQHVRISFKGGSASTQVVSAYVGVASGSNFNFASAPVRLTFNGGNSVSLGREQVVVSDSVALSVPSGSGIIVSYYVSTRFLMGLNAQAPGWISASKTSGDESSLTSVSGYQSQDTLSLGVTKIEVANDGAFPEIFKVLASGEVGIGVDTPTAKLDVGGSIRGNSGLTITAGAVSLPAGQIDNAELANSSLTVTPGTGLTGGGAVSLGESITVSAVTTGQGVSMQGNFGQWQTHSTYTDFNTNPAYWGWNYVQGNTNAPNSTSAQWYRNVVSLGSQYPMRGSGGYSLELAFPRTNQADAGVWMRAIESGAIGSWTQIGFTNPMTATGDLIYRNSGGTTRLGIGTAGQVLTVSGGVPVWASVGACPTCFVNNGNSLGALATIGTNDNQALAFETNSAERLRIDASGNVGIGTANPSVKLDVAGTLKATGFRLGESASAGQVLMANANGEGSWTSPMAGNPEISRVMSQMQYLYAPMKLINMVDVPNYSSDPLVLPDGYNGVNMYDGSWARPVYTPAVAANGTMFYVRTTASYYTIIKRDRTDLAADLTVNYGNIAIFRSDGSKWVYYGTQPIGQLNWTTSSAFVNGGNSLGAPAVLGTNDNNALALKTNNEERLRIDASGNVGMGTATPATKLDVAGAIRTNNQLISTVATGTAPLTITSTTVVANLNADLLDGRHASEFQLALTNPVTGTGTSGYLPKFTGTSTIGNSLIYDNGTNVGVGTSNPQWKFDVRDNKPVGSVANFQNDGDGDAIRLTSNDGDYWSLKPGGSFYIGFNGSNKIRIDTGGNMQIGLSSSGNGCVESGGYNVIAGTCNSDERLKTNISTVDENWLEKIVGIEIVNYNWKKNLNAPLSLGIIAQQLETVAPELVIDGEDGFKKIHFEKLPLYTIKGLQDLNSKVDTQSLRLSQQIDTLAATAPDIAKSVFSDMELTSKNYQSLEEKVALLDMQVADLTADKIQETTVDELNLKFLSQKDRIDGLELKLDTLFSLEESGALSFTNDITFRGRLTFEDKDMAGYAKIKKDSKEVKVAYEKPYEFEPVVTATALNKEIMFIVKERSKDGFTIEISDKAKESILFSWHAILVKEPFTAETIAPSSTPESTITSASESTSSAQQGFLVTQSPIPEEYVPNGVDIE